MVPGIFLNGLPSATALSAPCSVEPARWPPLPLERSSVCALSSSAVSPCRPRCSPADSRPAEASAPWSSYSTERGRDHINFAILRVRGADCRHQLNSGTCALLLGDVFVVRDE